MLRPFLRVARPRHYSGTLARIGCALLAAMLLLWAVLGAVPEPWIAAAFGQVLVVRGILVLLALWVMEWVRAFAYAALPRSAFTIFGRLWFRHKGGRRKLLLRELNDVWVERRSDPEREVFVVADKDGAEYDVCPVDWPGGARVWARIDGRVRRSKRAGTPSAVAGDVATSPPRS